MVSPRQPILNLPQPVSWLVAFLFLFHLVRQFLPPRLDDYLIYYLGFIPALYHGRFDGAGTSLAGSAVNAVDSFFAALIPLVTHTLIHADWLHLGFNLLWLMPFGAGVSRRLGLDGGGAWRFFVFYFVCGAAGAITHFIFYPNTIQPLVGASGAISGLMGGAARFIFVPGGFYVRRTITLAPLSDLRVIIFAAIFILINIVFGTIGFDLTESGGLIAWQAHVGGFLAGLFLFGFFDRT